MMFLRAAAAFSLLKALALALHYFGPSPYGGRLVGQPWRVFPNALLLETGILLALALVFLLLDRVLPGRAVRRYMRGLFLVLLPFHICLGQFDLEVIRWLGQHIDTSYIRTFLGGSDPQLLLRIFSGDILWSALAWVIGAAGIALSVRLWRRRRDESRPGRLALAVWMALALALCTTPRWFMPANTRWRRIQPPIVLLPAELMRSFFENPQSPVRAREDLLNLLGLPAPRDTAWPLWREEGAAALASPGPAHPDFVLLLVESMRGWKTGLHPDTSLASVTPGLDSAVRAGGSWFPYAYSNGFPSVEGGLSIHLGILPHFRRIAATSYTRLRTRSFPEVLRARGYHARALWGSDPSFDNSGAWLRKWYDSYEYDRARVHDGPLADRFVAMLAEEERAGPGAPPFLLTLATTTSHPPYNLPRSEGVVPAATDEGRYDQAMHYTDRQLVRILARLRASPRWGNMVVIITGDHSQPNGFQRDQDGALLHLSPGLAWTNFAVLGGWPGLPAPGPRNYEVSQIDLAPTILRLAGVRTTGHFLGRDLFDTAARTVIIFNTNHMALATGGRWLVYDLGTGRGLEFRRDPATKRGYGLLDAAALGTAVPPPDSGPLSFARVRDIAYWWGRRLDADGLMPPGSQP